MDPDSKAYQKLSECFNSTIKNEGVLGLWKGNFLNCLRYFPASACTFAFNEQFNRWFNKGD